mmetsp:Transcript_14867/g.38552  ORF Transcript_14867/g.38552 Transcript_14867/m.38552 type:complete len:211 (+) Transcript_14867:95-727(+)
MLQQRLPVGGPLLLCSQPKRRGLLAGPHCRLERLCKLCVGRLEGSHGMTVPWGGQPRHGRCAWLRLLRLLEPLHLLLRQLHHRPLLLAPAKLGQLRRGLVQRPLHPLVRPPGLLAPRGLPRARLALRQVQSRELLHILQLHRPDGVVALGDGLQVFREQKVVQQLHEDGHQVPQPELDVRALLHHLDQLAACVLLHPHHAAGVAGRLLVH